MIWLLPRLWRGIKLVFRKLAGLFGGNKATPQTVEPVRKESEKTALEER